MLGYTALKAVARTSISLVWKIALQPATGTKFRNGSFDVNGCANMLVKTEFYLIVLGISRYICGTYFRSINACHRRVNSPQPASTLVSTFNISTHNSLACLNAVGKSALPSRTLVTMLKRRLKTFSVQARKIKNHVHPHPRNTCFPTLTHLDWL